MNYLEEAKDAANILHEEGTNTDGLLAWVYAAIALTEQVARLASAAEKIAGMMEDNCGTRGFHVIAETLPYQC